MPKIKLSLEQTKDFLRLITSGLIKDMIYDKIVQIIEDTLANKIFVHILDEVYEINSAGEMVRLLKSGAGESIRWTHEGSYNRDYYNYKKRNNEDPHVHNGPPHMKNSVYINKKSNRIEVGIPSSATTRIKANLAGQVNVFDFGPIHESRKSILKSAIIMGWGKIEDAVLDSYFDEAKSV